MRNATRVSVVCAVIWAVAGDQNVQAQRFRRVGPGSTVQGDILRGEGVYLEGLGWYELNDARAEAINAKTQMAIANWNQQSYEYEMRMRSNRINAKKYKTENLRKEAEKRMQEHEAELRTKPTLEDIVSGDALNALLIDLSDPSISYTAWRLAKVDLPADITIRSLVFRFAPRLGNKTSQEISRGVIALGRLSMEGNWPKSLQNDKLAKEQEAYEIAYRNIKDKSLIGKLNYEDVEPLA
jgi:hypothetical protein